MPARRAQSPDGGKHQECDPLFEGAAGAAGGPFVENFRHVLSAIFDSVWWFLAAAVGRMMFHSREAQAGRRRFWGRELPFELVIAFGMGLPAYSVCAWLDLTGGQSAGLISAIGYLGPRAIDTLFERAAAALPGLFGKKDGA